jgi:hypothetical protein
MKVIDAMAIWYPGFEITLVTECTFFHQFYKVGDMFGILVHPKALIYLNTCINIYIMGNIHSVYIRMYFYQIAH